jgi:hypothetical protein
LTRNRPDLLAVRACAGSPELTASDDFSAGRTPHAPAGHRRGELTTRAVTKVVRPAANG